MYPRLQAEESLNGVAVAQAGSPLIEEKARRRMVDAWQDQLPKRTRKQERLTPEEFAQYMRALGMEAQDDAGNVRQ